jgi:hypothetical protein
MTASYIILKKIIPGVGTAQICASENKIDLLLADGWQMDLIGFGGFGFGGFGFESENDAWTMFASCVPGDVSEDLA